jgi:L-threonylcarbamoyladenylate synthase
MSSVSLARIRSADAPALAEAAGILRRGGLVAFPTETVYGLGANADDSEAVARLFEAKGRPRINPLIVHVIDGAAAERLGEFTSSARSLANKFWPGPLTLVLRRRASATVSLLVSAGLDTVALRVPAHPVSAQLLATARVPIAAPSANVSGRVSPTTAAHVAAELGDRVDLVLDGGKATLGLESTVIGFEGDEAVLLRPGAVSRGEIEAIAGPLRKAQAETVRSPGQLASHYAPRARLRLNASDLRDGEALLAYGCGLAGSSGRSRILNLSPAGDLREAASNLFAMLRELDASGAETIAVMPIPDVDLGEAINDRLSRAAAPRELAS